MRTLKFKVEEHPEYGGLGLRPLWIPNAEQAQPLQSAHDVMEHPPTGQDGIDVPNELRALGAMFYVRGLGGWFHRSGSHNPDPGYQLSGDIERMITDENVWGPCPAPPPTRPSREFPEIEEWISRAINLAVRTALDEFDDQEWVKRRSMLIKRNARGWMRVGFMDARRRYGNRDSCTLSDWYRRLMDMLGTALASSEEECEVHLRYSHREGPGYAWVVYPYEPEHSDYEPIEDEW